MIKAEHHGDRTAIATSGTLEDLILESVRILADVSKIIGELTETDAESAMFATIVAACETLQKEGDNIKQAGIAIALLSYVEETE